jgi:hypothetical protein
VVLYDARARLALKPLVNAPMVTTVETAIAAMKAITHTVCPSPRPEPLAANWGASTHKRIVQMAAATVEVAIAKAMMPMGTRANRGIRVPNSLRNTASESDVLIASTTKIPRVILLTRMAKSSTRSNGGCPAIQPFVAVHGGGPKIYCVAKR